MDVMSSCAILSLWVRWWWSICFYFQAFRFLKAIFPPTRNNVGVKSFGCFSLSLNSENLLFQRHASYVLRFDGKHRNKRYPSFFACFYRLLITIWGRGKEPQYRLSISFTELQLRAGLIAYHYTEVVFQSILHCYHMCESLTQSGCTQRHRKSDRYVLGSYYRALSFRGQGLSVEGSYSLFYGKKITQFRLLKGMRYSWSPSNCYCL